MTKVAAQEDDSVDVRTMMWNLIVGYRKSQIVRTAAMMSLAEHCSDGPVTTQSVADAESADLDATARFMRACTAIGLLTCHDGEHYTATALLDILRRDTPGSQWGFAVSLPAPGTWLPWSRLPEAVREGKSQVMETIGEPIFEYYERHPEEGAAFSAGLTGMTAVAGAQAAKVLDTSNVALAVDVGGATGSLMHDLMAVNPTLRGIVFDRPDVVPIAEQTARDIGLDDRVTVLGGDFFAAVPEGADMYLLRYVLHDWEDHRCVQILRRCREAMLPTARVVILEMVLGSIGDEPEVVPSQDLNMLALTGGRERTLAEFEVLLGQAGLYAVAVHATDSPLTVIEAAAG
jgi:precorrin-6B methylase 2